MHEWDFISPLVLMTDRPAGRGDKSVNFLAKRTDGGRPISTPPHLGTACPPHQSSPLVATPVALASSPPPASPPYASKA